MSSSEPRPIAVIGAGTMGSGIALKAAKEGIRVVLVDAAEGPLERGRGLIREAVDEAVARKILDPPRAAAITDRIVHTTDYGRCVDAELAIEAVFEDIEVKRQVFGKLDAVCHPDAIIATSTSSLHVGDLAG